MHFRFRLKYSTEEGHSGVASVHGAECVCVCVVTVHKTTGLTGRLNRQKHQNSLSLFLTRSLFPCFMETATGLKLNFKVPFFSDVIHSFSNRQNAFI